MSKKKIIISFIIGLMLAVLTAAGVLAIIVAARQTNGFTDSFKTFYTEYDGKVLSSTAVLQVERNTEYRFEVKNKFSAAKSEEYTAKVLTYATSQNLFGYSVDGRYYSYGSGKNVSKAFDLKQEDGYFTVSIPDSMQTVLQTIYPDCDVEVDNLDFTDTTYFKIQVTQNGGEQTTDILLLICLKAGEGYGDINLDKTEIIF